MERLAEVVLFLHDIGEALVTDIKEVNKRLHIPLLQQVHTDHLFVIDLMIVLLNWDAMREDLF